MSTSRRTKQKKLKITAYEMNKTQLDKISFPNDNLENKFLQILIFFPQT